MSLISGLANNHFIGWYTDLLRACFECDPNLSTANIPSALLVPAPYLFLGFILVFSYNDIIVS